MKLFFFITFVASILLFTAAGCIKSTKTFRHNQNNSYGLASTTPVIFYEKQTIIGFEPGGTPRGTSILFRKDGLQGRPAAVFTRDDGHVLGETEYSIEEGRLVRTIQNSTGPWTAIQTKTTFDFSGAKITTSTQQVLDGFASASLTSKDGSVAATSTMVCAEEVREGPCPITFHLKIANRESGTETTFEQRNFPIAEGRTFRTSPVAFSQDGSTVFVFLSGVGESFDPAALYAIDLHTYAITRLLKSNPPSYGLSAIDRISVLRMTNDRSGLLMERDFGTEATNGEILKIILDSQKVQKIADILPTIEVQQLKPDDSGVILQSSNGGFSYLDFAKGTTTSLSHEGYFLGWSHDGRYYLYKVFDDNGNRLGPFLLVVGSIETGTKTEIIRQTVTAQSVKTTTKIGDILYVPVGIW